MKFVPLINFKLLTLANSSLLKLTEHEFFSAYKYENANFISRENFMLSWVEHEKNFVTSRPDYLWKVNTVYWRNITAHIIAKRRENVCLNEMSALYSVFTITKTRLFKYIENFTSKNWKFTNKKLIYFSYFCSKYRLWVLVRTASARRF